MRVIAGSARRTPLKTLKGTDIRPTTDKIKETLFNMLQFELAGCFFLDLFAGSGGIGIEALSRGAAEAIFVDKNPKATKLIWENLQAARVGERAVVMNCDAIMALRRLEGKHFFDYIFLDPPYGNALEQKVFEELKYSSLIDRQSTIILETALDTETGFLERMGYVIERQKIYKTNRHIFIYRENG